MILLSLSKQKRLLKSIDFNRVFSNHYRVSNKKFSILGSLNKLGYPRLGCSISRKKIKLSNKRNNIKRLIRESFRLIQYKLISMDFVVVINQKNIHKQSNRDLIKALKNLWLRYC
ncbi:ribonuclease P protein component [Buchnera aphidicola]|uniref:Ribonuclease P protein component n=1 Tax=Buchnera aphidicola (Anoecia oenotherae) TaxID=1241833 RepID=A0A4D6XUW9_9GAMM|nr:ribonuclease P protein component [Buchnera aphidicola]QCI19157.1 ribonuclease P protein component [Buchnera aphidicola (Anoecia oenotherae)]